MSKTLFLAQFHSLISPPRPAHPPAELLLTSPFNFGLAPANRHVLVLIHVHNLPLHGEEEKEDKVEEENRPEYGDVEDGDECHDEASA